MLFSKLVRFLRSWREFYQGVRELTQLNDRELADLGLIRSDISRAAHEHNRHRGSDA